ncbi:MAG: EAL domain-containing protein [Alphaproteobacteria bacterium]|nr:EAL domain-containing protein [Alphaproteobacteria bacterium]
MPKGPKAPKTWYATSALFFLAVGAFYLAGALPFVDTGILAAQFTFFGRPATFGPLIATIVTAAALCLVYTLVRRAGRNPSRLRRQDDTVRHRQTMMNGAVDNSSDGILLLDEIGVILDANPAARQMLGAGAQDDGAQTLVGRHIGSLIPDATALMARPDSGAAPGPGIRRREMVAHRMDESAFPVEITMRELVDDGGSWQIAYVRDITDQKAHHDALEHQALHDALTGLPNRTLLYDRMHDCGCRARRTGDRFALLVVDLNRFKEINDTLGHHIGDLVLQQIARRLTKLLRSSDMIARLGGDEFALLLSPVLDRFAVTNLSERLKKALDAPLLCNGLTLDVNASVGAAIFPDDGTDMTELIQKADVAMYVAKNAGLPMAFYDEDQDHHSVRHLTLVSLTGELGQAIEREELELHYQPRISIPTNQVIGVESLARWRHPVHGFVPADEFVAVAEHTGLIHNLTEWALRSSIEQCARWRAAGIDLTVSVNLSAKTLQDNDLPQLIRDLLDGYGVEPGRLIMEFTEDAIMADMERCRANIVRLAEYGLKISIDDFGTGYSSLACLKALPVHELKIDTSFVRDMLDDEDHQTIVRSTIDLAHNFGLTASAEGVESGETLALLAAMGCDGAQGYFIGRPLPVPDFEDWLRARQAPQEARRLVSVAAGGD